MSTQGLLKASVIGALLTGLLFLVFNVLRLAFVANIMHVFLLMNMAVFASIAVIGLVQHRRLILKPIEWWLIGALFVCALGTHYTGRLPVNIAIDLLRPILFILTVATLRNFADLNTIVSSPTIRLLLGATVGITALAVVFCAIVDSAIHPLYPAYSTIDSILGLGWLMATNSPAAQLLYALVLFISGKRGVYIVAVFLFLLLYRNHRRFLYAAGGLALVMGLALLFASPERRIDMSAFFVKSSIDQLQITVHNKNFNAFDYVTDVVSGGRTQEIKDATASVTSPWSYAVGEGLGFSYHSAMFEPEGKQHRNLHFTPLCLIIYYGAGFFLLFAAYLGGMVRAAWACFHTRRTNPVMFAYASYFLASLPFCLTEYSVFVYANFAVACGLLEASRRDKQSVSPARKTL